MADLLTRARDAERHRDLAGAAAVHNLAALLASDVGLPDLARQWCHRQANAYLRATPLNAQAACHALEPLVNLARLHIRDGEGEGAFQLIDTLHNAVSNRTAVILDGTELPADLTDSDEAHRDVRRWLWSVYLATTARALATAGRWHEAADRLRAHKGIGRRMLDGRQVQIVAHLTTGDIATAQILLNETAPGEPWEHAVTAALTFLTQGNNADATDALARYDQLDATAPGLSVFHTRLGLTLLDALGGTGTSTGRRLATDLATRTIASHDGYTARDVLHHPWLAAFLTKQQRQRLQNVLVACALGTATLPQQALTQLNTALDITETTIAHLLALESADGSDGREGAAPRRSW